MRISVAFMLVIAMVEANQCSIGGECPSDEKPQNSVSLLQANVRKVGGDETAPGAFFQRSDGDGDVPSSPRVALLVHTYHPTAVMTKRIAKWVSSVPSNVDAFVSIDISIPHNLSPLLDTLHRSGFDDSHIHRYTTDEMHKAYHALDGKTRLAYQYVTAATDLFLQSLNKTYDYFWVLEDDVGYSGDLSKLMEKYSGSDDDLISGKYYPMGDNKYVDDAQSDLYKEWVPREKRVESENHVVRMSFKLLGRISHWMKEGAIHQAEEMPPTICKMEDMKCSALAEADLGYPYEFQSTHDLTFKSAANWTEAKRKDAEAGKHLLYHPVKI